VAATPNALSKPPRQAQDDNREAFRIAMRDLAGGVSVITTGAGVTRAGLTATSVSSLSMDPPSILVCINRLSSVLPVLIEQRAFGVNMLGAGHRHIADRFAGRDGVRGAARYAGEDWITLATGAPLLADAVAAVDCSLEQTVEWYSHLVIIGRVRAVHLNGGASPLVYWRGNYKQLSPSLPRLSRMHGDS
jgi:flavin reductase (DIM6/NTAB) family NADH-FMN oxidoreductase RutF